MQLLDLEGTHSILSESELLQRLKSIRRDEYGAFALCHENAYPALFIHTNGRLAYVHYFESEMHPGYQSTGMTPSGCDEDVRFIQTSGSDADTIQMPCQAVVSEEIAFNAAVEFLQSPKKMPSAVEWLEL